MQQVPGAFDEAVIVAALAAERRIPGPVAEPFMLDKPNSLTGPPNGSRSPQVQSSSPAHRWLPRWPDRTPVRSRRLRAFAQHRARHQFVEQATQRTWLRLPVFLRQFLVAAQRRRRARAHSVTSLLERGHRRVNRNQAAVDWVDRTGRARPSASRFRRRASSRCVPTLNETGRRSAACRAAISPLARSVRDRG